MTDSISAPGSPISDPYASIPTVLVIAAHFEFFLLIYRKNCWLLNELACGGLLLRTFVYAEWVRTGSSDIGADHSATRKFAKASTTMAKADLWKARLAIKTLRRDQREAIAAAAEDAWEAAKD